METPMNSAWVMLFVAGLVEIGWAIGLKASTGSTRPRPAALTIVALIASVLLRAKARLVSPMGPAYAVWVGIGGAGTVLFGIVIYAESASVLKMCSLAAVLLGLVGLKLTDA